jgi:vacuolar-type H+-ATPase subunit C/Vma6
LFDPANAKLVQKILEDTEKITDFMPLVNPSILNFLKEKKIEIANIEKLIIAEEPKVEKVTEKPKEETKPAETKEESSAKAQKS